MIQKDQYRFRYKAIITSPPYYRHRVYGDSSKEIGHEKSVNEYLDKLAYIFTLCRDLLTKDGTLWIVIGDTRYKQAKLLIPHRLAKLLIEKDYLLQEDIAWFKRNNVPTSSKENFSSAYEYILFLSKSKVDKITRGINKYGNMWDISTRAHSGQQHYAIFPEELVERIIKIATEPNDNILDPFAGRGTTGIVSMNMNRNFTGIELYPNFVRLIKKNFKN